MVDGRPRLMSVEGAGDRPVNLGTPFEIPISVLAGLVISLAGSRSRLEFRPLPQDDPRKPCPDITRAEQRLHWLPPVPRKGSLTRTLPYFETLLSSPNEAKKFRWRIASSGPPAQFCPTRTPLLVAV